VSYSTYARKDSDAPALSSKAASSSVAGGLRIGEPNDVYEQEADRVANEVMAGGLAKRHWSLPRPSGRGSLQRKCSCGGSGGECEQCKQEKEEKMLQRKAAGHAGSDVAPPIVHEVLNSPGQPLDRTTREFFEPRFGMDFSKVRVHTGGLAASSAEAVNSLAYTVGNAIIMNSGQYQPHAATGQSLIAHELTHVAQNSGTLQRFEKSERSEIAPHYGDVLNTAKDIADKSVVTGLVGGGNIDWPTFVDNAGGFGFKAVAASASGLTSLPNRYLFSCRCGLIDFRHFYQLMWIAMVKNNAKATEKGREHELTSEPESRFAPEDTPSNAMGALFGSFLEKHWASYSPDQFVAALRQFLNLCAPVDFASMPTADQDTVVDYYGERNPDKTPKNPNESATPATLSVSACATGGRALPFNVDTGDPNKKTLTGPAYPYGLTFQLRNASEVRDWVTGNASAVIAGIEVGEKIRLLKILLDGWVHDSDVAAVEKICNSITNASEMTTLRAAIAPLAKAMNSSGQRSRVDAAINRTP
jgi:hypothetical protein